MKRAVEQVLVPWHRGLFFDICSLNPPLFFSHVLSCNPEVLYLYSSMKGRTELKEDDLVELLEEVSDPFHLIVWNDEVNTFEWVIETLMEICHHSYEQAEQCAYIIHFKGKYAVKHGSYESLKPMCDAITERGIGATVEMVPA